VLLDRRLHHYLLFLEWLKPNKLKLKLGTKFSFTIFSPHDFYLLINFTGNKNFYSIFSVILTITFPLFCLPILDKSYCIRKQLLLFDYKNFEFLLDKEKN